MRSVCLINNFNYGHFLRECLAGALAQTSAFDAIVVVDDGSTDDSRGILEELRARHRQLEVVLKPNGGQLSSFHAALPFVLDDDLVVLCDADDLLPRDYLQHLLPRFAARGTDLSYCETREFSSSDDSRLATAFDSDQPDVALACTSALARRCKWWFCRPTSCIALTGRLYREILPYPFEQDWRISADKVIGFGASLLGARKLYVPSLKIGYRVHGTNLNYRRIRSAQDKVRRRHQVERLLGWYCARQHISTEASERDALDEYRLLSGDFKARFKLRASKGLLRGHRLLLFHLKNLIRLRG